MAATVALVGRGYEPKHIQCASFYSMVATFLAFLLLRSSSRTPAWVLYVAYVLINCAMTGANVTTFILPSATYPPTVRGTLNGASSALGKLGAVLGTELFPAVAASSGLDAVLLISAAVSLLGALLTHLCVDDVLANPIDHAALDDKDRDEDDDDNRFRLISRG